MPGYPRYTNFLVPSQIPAVKLMYIYIPMKVIDNMAHISPPPVPKHHTTMNRI